MLREDEDLLFSSITFLYLFLPLTLMAYLLAPRKGKNAVLLLASLVFYFWGEPRQLPLLVLSALAGWGFGLAIHRTKAKWTRYLAVVVCTAPLLVYKYADFLIASVNSLFGVNLPLTHLPLPVGISFYTFQILSYLIDVGRETAKLQKNPINFTAYVTLFPQLIAGPIVRYETIQNELDSRRETLADFSAGITRFCVGLGKKVLLANQLAELQSLMKPESVLSCWMLAIAFTLQIYFDFSGYSDMAIGLGRMFGFHFMENFNYPFLSKSVAEFWRRWHISLGSWLRDYIYIPLGGNRCGSWKWLRNILIVWLVTGLWHGAAWTFAVWGLYFAALLLGEKLLWGRLLEKAPKAVRVLYTLLFVVVSFVIFNAQTMGAALSQLGGMVGIGVGAASAAEVYYAKSFLPLLLICAIGATPLPKLLAAKLGKARTVAEPLYCAALLLLVTAFLVEGSFNPFLYFRF